MNGPLTTYLTQNRARVGIGRVRIEGKNFFGEQANTNLYGSDFIDCDFQVRFLDSIFMNQTFSKALFSHSTFVNCIFDSVTFNECIFKGSYFYSCLFHGCYFINTSGLNPINFNPACEIDFDPQNLNHLSHVFGDRSTSGLVQDKLARIRKISERYNQSKHTRTQSYSCLPKRDTTLCDPPVKLPKVSYYRSPPAKIPKYKRDSIASSGYGPYKEDRCGYGRRSVLECDNIQELFGVTG